MRKLSLNGAQVVPPSVDDAAAKVGVGLTSVVGAEVL
jgi:hypothetical protein